MDALRKYVLAQRLKPYVEELIDLLAQLDQLNEQKVDEPCVESDYKCILSRKYGILVNDLEYSELKSILNAVDTVGLQLSECYNNASEKPEPDQVFKQIFSDFEFIFQLGNTESYGQTSYMNDTTNRRIIITLGKGVFGKCVAQPLDPNVTLSSIGERPELPCPDGVQTALDGTEYQWVYTSYTDRTIEGVIRHEIGHAFLNKLIEVYGEDFQTTYEGLVINLKDTQDELRDNKILPNDYFINSVGERSTAYNDGQKWTEDFADSFSMMGRFFVPIEQKAFVRSDDRDNLQNTNRYNVFHDNFCCWLARIINQPELCSNYQKSSHE